MLAVGTVDLRVCDAFAFLIACGVVFKADRASAKTLLAPRGVDCDMRALLLSNVCAGGRGGGGGGGGGAAALTGLAGLVGGLRESCKRDQIPVRHNRLQRLAYFVP